MYLNNIAGSVISFENRVACVPTKVQVDFLKTI